MTSGTLSISFEFYPPKTEGGADRLQQVAAALSLWRPRFVSVTCGAGGSAADGTFTTARRIREQCGLEVVPHIAIARETRSHIRAMLDSYKELSVHRVVAVRGDDAPGGPVLGSEDSYPNTVDFVAELSATYRLDPIVAAYPDVHPRALSPAQDLDHLKRKVAAGAAIAITQFFFQPEAFARFRDKVRAAGIDIPLVPGIMPIHNFAQVAKFAESCGTAIPPGFAARFERHGANAEACFAEGVAHATTLCDDLRREGVDAFHFYTLNRDKMTAAVLGELGAGIRDSEPGKTSAHSQSRIPASGQ